MNVFLLDGTYELFRHFFALPSLTDASGREMAAVRGVVGSVIAMLEDGVTHLGVATDHVVDSFRNDLYEGYKSGEGIDAALLQQFHPLEDALRALGVAVWPMVEFEADDALASAARLADEDTRVEQVFICTPDKDLAQCVRGNRVVQFDRRAGVVRDADAVRERFGVSPDSIVDYLALVGDASDGYPGLPGWGAKSASIVLARYRRLEDIPADPDEWDVKVRGSSKLARVLAERRDDLSLFRDLATLRTTASVCESVDDLRWSGPDAQFFDVCASFNASGYFRRAQALADARLNSDDPQG
jgi:5'-3' exonuclease